MWGIQMDNGTGADFYYETLKTMKDDLDAIDSIRQSHHRLKTSKLSWWQALLLHLLFGIKKINSPTEEQVKKIVGTLTKSYVNLVIMIGGTVSAGALWKFTSWPWGKYIAIAVPIVSVVLSGVAIFGRMLTIGDPIFHEGMYFKFRVKEHKIFSRYIYHSTFTFNGLYDRLERDYINKKMDNEKVLNVILSNNAKLEEDAKVMLNERDILNSKINSMNSRYAELRGRTEELIAHNELLLRGYNLALDLLQWLKEPAKLKTEHLGLISAYSVYVLRKKTLHLIAELGTTDIPEKIDIDDSRYAHYSSVLVIKKQTEMEEGKPDPHGRFKASYRFVMPNTNIWVYNFHYYEHDEYKFDIIRTQEFYRLIKITCCLLQQRNLLKDGGEDYAQVEGL